MAHVVACLDLWAQPVREAVRRVAPAEFELRFAQSYDEAEQLALAEPADFLLTGFAAVGAAMMERATRLRMIQKWGIGYDRIDLDAARRRGIALSIAAGCNAAPVAELAIALMLGVYRRLPYVNRVMRQGQWPNAAMRESCFQISGRTVGLIGFGNIGRMLARRIRGFDARVLYFDPLRAGRETEVALNAQFVPMNELLAQSDIVSLHAPLTPLTRKMVNAGFIARMKDGAVLINTARGEQVDEAALYAALVSGKLRGAGLDVFDPEPPRPDNPLLRLDQVALAPHGGGGVFDNVEHVARHALGNIERFIRGEALASADVIIAAPVSPVAA